MSTKSITGTGLLLAVALLAQSLRLIFPFIPNQVSMFLIGSITSATFVLATWRYGWKNGLVIAWIAPVVAHLQGMLPLPPFILITALGTTAYVFVAHWLQHKPKVLLIFVAALVKAGVLFGGYSLFFSLFQLIRRYMKHVGYKVTYVQNFTDVDDKIINTSNGEGVSWDTIANRYIDSYFEVMDALGVQRADIYPRVSTHIEDIIAMISTLIEKGYAYELDGDVYYSVDKLINSLPSLA